MWRKLFPDSEAGIGRVQSALVPSGTGAQAIAELWWVLFWVCTAVFIVVLILLGVAMLLSRKSNAQPPLGTSGFIIVSGILLPTIVVVYFLFLSLTGAEPSRPGTPDLEVEVTGHLWWWEVRYPQSGIVTANELYLPVDKAVRLKMVSADVVHSLWIPRLNGKMDLLPDHPTYLWLTAKQTGVFRGQCAEYCGVQHAWMALDVVSLSQADFTAWEQSRTPPAPSTYPASVLRGAKVFEQKNCHNCHAVRGAMGTATGEVGPDLTHMGARRTLGAGLAANTRQNMRRWILDPQGMKPGNRMPATPLSDDALEDLLDYMEFLK